MAKDQDFSSATRKDMPGPEDPVPPKTLEKVYQQGGFDDRLKKLKQLQKDIEEG